MHHRMMVVFHMIEQAVLLKPRDNGFAAFLAAHAGEFAVAFNHVGGFVEDIDFLEVVALAHREVVRVVSRSDLHEARTEIGIDMKVG